MELFVVIEAKYVKREVYVAPATTQCSALFTLTHSCHATIEATRRTFLFVILSRLWPCTENEKTLTRPRHMSARVLPNIVVGRNWWCNKHISLIVRVHVADSAPV